MRSVLRRMPAILLLLAVFACADLNPTPADPDFSSSDQEGFVAEPSAVGWEDPEVAKQPTIPPGPDHQEGVPGKVGTPDPYPNDLASPEPSPTNPPHMDYQLL